MNTVFCVIFEEMRTLSLILICCFSIGITSFQPVEDQPLRIAVASNMQFAARDIALAFTAKTGVKCQLTVASSGKHYAQIVNGAKVDVFISANKTYLDELRSKGKAKTIPTYIAGSPLVLWSNTLDVRPTMHMLRDDKVKKVAIANPNHAPLGRKALLCLNRETNLTVVKRKLVYAENIAQVNHLVMSKAVDVGITSRSSVMAPQTRNKGKYAHTTCGIVKQYIAITTDVKLTQATAQKFVAFVSQGSADKILTKHGYIVPARK